MSSEFWDRRALALFRIGLGLYLIWYSGLCLIWGNTFFTDLGVLPMSYLTGRPEENGYGSLYLASRWWVWAYFLMSCQLLLSVGVTIGYRTTAISGPLALLVWSLNARNPYVSGLTEDWLLLLILVLGTLPVTEEFRVRESRVWGSSYSCLEGPRNLVAWLLLLALPGAWVCEQIFTQPSSGWTWVGLLSLGGLVAPARWRALRNLSVLLFAVWAVVGWSGHSLALVGVLVALAFVRSEPATETTGSAASVPLVLAVLLQAHWALYQIGTVSESFPTVIQRERAIASDSYRLFGFTTGRESALGLYRSLDARNVLMRRYLNSLYYQPDKESMINLMTYYSRTSEALGIDDTRTYTILLEGTGVAATPLVRLETKPKGKSIWEAMPALDRNPLQ